MRTQTTQAKRLEEFMSRMRDRGYEVGVNSKGNVWGIRRGNGYQAARDMIRGKKAYYSRDYFRQVGALIMEKTSLRVVDTAA